MQQQHTGWRTTSTHIHSFGFFNSSMTGIASTSENWWNAALDVPVIMQLHIERD
jgi:hypothetical protein